MRTLLRVFSFFAALTFAHLNYSYISPALWSHNSSAAFDMWLFLWLVSIAGVIGTFFWVINEAPRAKP